MNKHERVFTRPLGKVLQVSVSSDPRGMGKMDNAFKTFSSPRINLALFLSHEKTCRSREG